MTLMIVFISDKHL